MEARKVFVSLPMRGISLDEISLRQHDLLKKFIELSNPEYSYELLDSIHEDELPEPGNPLWFLGRSIQTLGQADFVIFAKDWRKASGCRVEHLICELYHIPYIYETTEDPNDDDERDLR